MSTTIRLDYILKGKLIALLRSNSHMLSANVKYAEITGLFSVFMAVHPLLPQFTSFSSSLRPLTHRILKAEGSEMTDQ